MKNSVFVRSREEWESISQAFEDAGYIWCDGDKLTEWNPYDENESLSSGIVSFFIFDFREDDHKYCSYYISEDGHFLSGEGMPVIDAIEMIRPETFNNEIRLEDLL